MKKSIVISLFLFLIILICLTGISLNKRNLLIQKQKNNEYEIYLNKDIYGTDVATILNKAINQNEINNVEKDKKDNYIENSENSIIVELVMITNEEKNETTTYRMEKIAKVGINEFITNFNTQKFKITKIQYHEMTGKISYIEISQCS